MIKKFFCAVAALALISFLAGAKEYKVTSPSGELAMTVNVSKTDVRYNLDVKGHRVVVGARIAMELADGTVLGANPVVRTAAQKLFSEHIDAPFYRQSSIDVQYNALTIIFSGGWALDFRAYNDGVAYRFRTSRQDAMSIKNEVVEYSFSEDCDLVVPYARAADNDPYHTSFESFYTFQKNSEAHDGLAFFPILAKTSAGNLILSESDVEAYPGMFVEKTSDGFRGVFTPVPADTKFVGRGEVRPTGYSDVIANVAGSRTFPWRMIGYAAADTDIPVNNLTWALASPSRIYDTSWITPGLSSWDWWNDFNLDGVDFEAGINTAYYKYHIDFAAKYGLQYIILDEGWYNPRNLDSIEEIAEVDIPELCRYAYEKNVKVVLWITFGRLDKDLEAICAKYSQMGVAGFKVDFLDAQSQIAVESAWRIAEVAARHHLVLDYHGFYKPAGLNRTYPNVLNFEGVLGLENCKWYEEDQADFGRNDATIPYLRQVAGPIDYTQGAMHNGAAGRFRAIYSEPMSQGTRAHQIALYVVFDSPFEMLCDTPSNYLREDATTRYIASIPTVFDSTRILCGEVGEYIVTLREKDGKYYVGGITNRTAREVTFKFDFLPEGEWNVALYSDGANSGRVGSDFVLSSKTVSNSDEITVPMAPTGGFTMIISK